MSVALRVSALVLFAFLESHSATVEVQDFQGESGVVASVDGKDRKLYFSTRFPDSYLSNGNEDIRTVRVGDQPFAKVPLHDADKLDLCGAEGALGMDALRQVALAFDPQNEKLEILSSTQIGLAGAKEYFAKLPDWNGPARIVKLPLGRAEDGTPILEMTADGQKTSTVLSLSTYDTFLDPTVRRPKETNGKDEWSYAPAVAFPGLPPTWLEYSPDADWNAEEEGAHGEVALDAFLSRRVVVDLAGDAVYVEALSKDQRLSLLLAHLTRFPLIVSGEDMTIDDIPGLEVRELSEVYKGAKIVRMAGYPASEWLRDLRGDSAEAAVRLSKRLPLFDKDFTVTAIFKDGEERTFNVPQTPDSRVRVGSLRAGARARVGSRSR